MRTTPLPNCPLADAATLVCAALLVMLGAGAWFAFTPGAAHTSALPFAAALPYLAAGFAWLTAALLLAAMAMARHK